MRTIIVGLMTAACVCADGAEVQFTRGPEAKSAKGKFAPAFFDGKLRPPHGWNNRFRVEVVDTSNNWIGSFGHYGNQDSGGPDATVKAPEIPLAWPAYVAVSDKYAHVSDSISLRIVRVKLNYEADETCAVK